jgi:intraflagellar transport protein 56
MTMHQKLQNTIEDQMSLAALHFLRSHYQEATEIYKKLLLENREFLALNVYIALCYYRLDYYDVSLEVLNGYLGTHPDSAVALNLKACNHYRLYNGQSAEEQLKPLLELESEANGKRNELVEHNLVVFRNGAGALSVLPKLVNLLPEARMNLAIYYLRNGESREAYELMKEVEPVGPQEYILKGIVNALEGQKTDNAAMLKMAQQYFQIVGSSASECDTIPGRQSMASCFYLMRQFEDVLVYLRSIKAYFHADEDFNYNYGVALAETGNYKEAEEALALVNKYKDEFCYRAHLCRAWIHNGKAKAAWELYEKLDTSTDAFQLLQLIANDSFKTEQFAVSAKAFEILERLDPSQEYMLGRRASVSALIQFGVQNAKKAEKLARESLREALEILQKVSQRDPQCKSIMKVVVNWIRETGFKL